MIGAGSQTRLRSDTIIFVMAVMGAIRHSGGQFGLLGRNNRTAICDG